MLSIVTLTAFISLEPTQAYRIENLSRNDGYSGIKTTANGILTWNMYSGSIRFSNNDKSFDYAGLYPADVFQLNDSQAVVVQYLNPCSLVINLQEGIQKERCLRDNKWVPAAYCKCGDTTLMAAFRTVAKNGVEKSFPYYVPVINRFQFTIEPADEFLNTGYRKKRSAINTLFDNWHEESAGLWKMICAGKGEVILLNPSGEKLLRVNYISGKKVWQAKTGKRPLALVLDTEKRRAFIASAQEEFVEVFETRNGKMIERIKVGKGLRKMIWAGEALYAIDPYSRRLVKIDPDIHSVDNLIFSDIVPVDISEKQDVLYVANGKGELVIRVDRNLNRLGAIEL